MQEKRDQNRFDILRHRHAITYTLLLDIYVGHVRYAVITIAIRLRI